MPWRGLGGHDEKQNKRTPLVHKKVRREQTKRTCGHLLGPMGAQNGVQRVAWGAKMGPKRDPVVKGGSKMDLCSPEGANGNVSHPFVRPRGAQGDPRRAQRGAKGSPEGG